MANEGDSLRAREEQERARRRAILSDLANQGILGSQASQPLRADPSLAHAPVPAPLLPPRTQRWRRPWLWGLLVALVCAVVVGSILIPPLFSHTAAPVAGPVSITPFANDLACPVDVVWSPDGKLVAIAGYRFACPNDGPDAFLAVGQVDMYTAATGRLFATLHPDTLITNSHTAVVTQALQQQTQDQSFAPVIAYTALAWSPDGRQLALPFVVLESRYAPFPTPANPAPSVLSSSPAALYAAGVTTGVLLTDVDGMHTSVMGAKYHPVLAAASATHAYQAQGLYGPSVEWNLHSGAPVTTSLNLTPALAYQWGAQGQLTPETPLTTQTAPTSSSGGPVGNPIGGANFTIWQPGSGLQGQLPAPPTSVGTPQSAILVPGLFLWDASFLVWSPDGQYLITPTYYGGRVVIAGQAAPSAQALAATGQTQTPLLPPRDSALQYLYSQSSFLPSLAWRPDGQTLASFSFGRSQGAAEDVLTLYDTHSSAKRMTLIVKNTADYSPRDGFYGLGSQTDHGVFLRWSPDGSHLLLFDINRGSNSVITIWHVAATV